MDALEMLLNPEESTVEASYVYFFAYDATPEAVGHHVADLEHTHVFFEKGIPKQVQVSWHSSDSTYDWSEMTKVNGHPVVFNARGTHATYKDQGLHLTDWTEMKEAWDMWLGLDVLFPWDWNNKDRVISTDSNINGLNYLTQVRRWGNAAMGPEIVAGETILDDGPSGFLDKFHERRQELEEAGFAC